MTKKTKKKPKPSRFDWTAIERDWRAGILSHSDIARKYGVDEAQMRRRAKRFGWTKDLREQIRSRALVVLRTLEQDGERVRAEQAGEKPGEDPRTDEDVIDDAIRTQLGVILDHRKTIRTTRELCENMLSELAGQTYNQEAIEQVIEAVFAGPDPSTVANRLALRRMLSLANRATTLVNLSNALGKLVATERQAFGLEEKAVKDPVKVDAEKVVRTDGRTDIERAAAVLNMVERAARAKQQAQQPGTDTVQ